MRPVRWDRLRRCVPAAPAEARKKYGCGLNRAAWPIFRDTAGLGHPIESERVAQLRSYMKANKGLKRSWKKNAVRYLLSDGI